MSKEPLHQLLLRAQSAMNREIMGRAASLGLSPGQPKVLEYLLAVGESNQKAIADHCEIEPSTVGTILGRMERDGLIRREAVSRDARLKRIVVTDKALAYRQAVMADILGLEGELTRGIAPEDMDVFFRVMEQMLDNMR